MKNLLSLNLLNLRSISFAGASLLFLSVNSLQDAAAATFAPTKSEINARADRPVGHIDLSGLEVKTDDTGRRFYLLDDRRYSAAAVEADNAFTGNQWPGGVVYYQYAPSVSALNRTTWQTAAARWSSVAGLTFTEGIGSGNYIYVQPSSDNNSYVGMIGGQQDMNLNSWSSPVIVHELGHALGLEHEQSRSDRDSFVVVYYDNILPGYAHNFDRILTTTNYGPYDFVSIMHYDRLAFSSNGQDTLEPQSPYSNYLYTIGTAQDLSALDASGMAQRYPRGGAGAVVAEYSFAASSFAMSPTQPYMYATIPSQNSIAIINSKTLVVENTVFVGSGPANIAFSPDGLTAYIANTGSSFVVVFNTQTRAITNSLLIPEAPRDVVAGNQNRLFVLGSNSIFQIDATTGVSAGPKVTSSSLFIYSGALEISPDRNFLYYGDYGLSPSTMYKFDVSTPIATELWQTPFGSAGSNGQDLTLSHGGKFISFACGAGQGGYQIAKYRTSDLATLGVFVTGAYPSEIAFSPDDSVAYTVHTSGQIDVFDANTFLPLGQFLASGQASELSVDSTGKYLFAGYTDGFGGAYTGTRVFETGRGPTLPHGDFNQDGQSDLVWQNDATGERGLWLMNGTQSAAEFFLPTVDRSWQIAGTGDFNGDGQADIVWQNTSTGERGIWLMNGHVLNSVVFLPSAPLSWQIAGTGDFDGDGQTDILWQETNTGARGVWLMRGTTFVSAQFLPSAVTEWRIAGTGDFNNDGNVDILWENTRTGERGVWLMNRLNLSSVVFLPTVPVEWQIAGTGSFNADPFVDIIWQNSRTGERGVWLMNGSTLVVPIFLPTIATVWQIRNH